MKPFKSILEFQKTFDTNDKCREYLELQIWNGKPICPYCGCEKSYKLTKGHRYNCANPECKRTFSVTVGTIFENTKIPLTKWFYAMYILAVHSKGISSLQLSIWLNVTQKTAWFLNHRIRQTFGEKTSLLLGNMVEVDETYVGGKFKNKRLSIRKTMVAISGSHEHKTAVMGLLERDGKVITQVVDDTKRETVLPILLKTIIPGSTLHTDSSHIYTPLKNVFKHESVNHTQNEYVRGNVHTNTIEGFWSLLKRQIVGIHHNVSPQHLQRYCNEASYRYNQRGLAQDERFADTLKNSKGGRLTYDELIDRI